MAKVILKDAVITINGTDLSDHFSEISLTDEADEVELTGFTTTGYREFGVGLKDATITGTVFQDFAASSLDSILYPMYQNGTTGTVKVRDSVSSTVVYTMISKLYSYSPLAGAVGEASTTEVTFRNAGTAGLTRGTA